MSNATIEKTPRKASGSTKKATAGSPDSNGRKPRVVSDSQKAAMAEGREQGRAVAAYLEALEQVQGPKKRGRKRTPDSIAKRLEQIDRDLPTASPVRRLSLIQERIDLLSEQEALTNGQDIDLTELEGKFADVAGTYGSRKGISYAAWRELGVPPSVLKRAGIGRGV